LGLEPLGGISSKRAQELMSQKAFEAEFVVWDLWYRNLDQFALDYMLCKSRVRRLYKIGIPLEDIRFYPDLRNPGLYSMKALEQNPGLATQPATLYLVAFSLDGRSIVKVGITCSTVEKRFQAIKAPVTILAEYQGQLVDCFQGEQFVLEIFEYVYELQRVKGVKIEGKTEMFYNEEGQNAFGLLSSMSFVANMFSIQAAVSVRTSSKSLTFPAKILPEHTK
jgi:hypothetical protein